MNKIDFQQAVVLSGGGAKGAYEVGVMKTLFNGKSKSTARRKINPGIFSGTSVGSFNAAVMVSHSEDHSSKAVQHLEQIWLDEIADRSENGGNGVFRFRGVPSGAFNPGFMVKNPLVPVGEMIEDTASLAGDWLKRMWDFSFLDEPFSRKVMEFVNISSVISLDPFHRLLKKHLHVEEIQGSKRALRIATTKWKTGELCVYRNPAGEGNDFQIIFDPETALNVVAASSAIPGIFPPVNINGEAYVDGGVVMNTPLKSAILAGAEVIHVVFLEPEVKDIPVDRLENTLDTVERLMVMMTALVTRRDLAAARRINSWIQAGGSPQGKKGRDFRPLTIHCYRPKEDFGGILGLLNFDLDRIRQLIRIGAQDALNHDCAANGCIIPG